jgi:transposase-like protein
MIYMNYFPALMSTSKKKVVRGKRYSTEEKSKVVTFITEYNATNGRGGQTAAVAKFGISQLSIAAWLKKSGVKSSTKASGKASKKASTKTVVAKGGNQVKKLSAMLSLSNEIEKLESNLKAKQAQFNSLKASL